MSVEGYGRGSHEISSSELSKAHIRVKVKTDQGHEVKEIRLDQVRKLINHKLAEARGVSDTGEVEYLESLSLKLNSFYSNLHKQADGSSLDVKAHSSSCTDTSRMISGEVKKGGQSEKVDQTALKLLESDFRALKHFANENASSSCFNPSSPVDDFSSISKENIDLRSENVSNRIAIVQLQSSVGELQEEVDTLTGQKRELIDQLQLSKIAFNQKCQQLEGKEAELQELQEKYDHETAALSERIASLEATIESKNTIISTQLEQMLLLSHSNRALRAELDDTKGTLETRTDELARCREEVNELQRNLGTSRKLHKSLAERHSETIKELQKTRKQRSLAIGFLKASLKSGQTEGKKIATLQKEVAQLNTKFLGLTMHEESQAQRINEIEQSMAATELALANARGDIRVLTDEVATRGTRIEELSADNARKDEQIRRLQAELRQAQGLSQITKRIPPELVSNINSKYEDMISDAERSSPRSGLKYKEVYDSLKVSAPIKDIVNMGGVKFSELWERVTSGGVPLDTYTRKGLTQNEAKIVILKAGMDALSEHAAGIAVSKIKAHDLFEDKIRYINRLIEHDNRSFYSAPATGDKSMDRIEAMIDEFRDVFSRLLQRHSKIPRPQDVSINSDYAKIMELTRFNLGRGISEQGFINHSTSVSFADATEPYTVINCIKRISGTETAPSDSVGAPYTSAETPNNYSDVSGGTPDRKLSHFQAIHATALANVYYIADKARESFTSGGASSLTSQHAALQITPKLLEDAQALTNP